MIAVTRTVTDDGDPVLSAVTWAVACACGAGYPWGKLTRELPDGSVVYEAFLDTTEKLPDGKLERTVAWVFDAEHTVEHVRGERPMDFATYWRCLHDLEWCEAHPDHPITLQAAGLRHYTALIHKLTHDEPHPVYGGPLIRHLRYRRADGKGKRRCDLPLGMPRDERYKRLREWGFA